MSSSSSRSPTPTPIVYTLSDSSDTEHSPESPESSESSDRIDSDSPDPSQLSDRSPSVDSVSTLESSTSSSIDSENISTKKPAEWSALPVDLRAMCIRKMDFKTSMKLRGVSRLDKRIVEAPCYRPSFDRLTVDYSSKNYHIRVYADAGEEQIEMHDQITRGNYDEKVECLIISLLKYTNIRHLTLRGFNYDCKQLFEEMAEVGAVIPGLSLDDLSDGNFELALEIFGVGVQLFDFVYPSNRCLRRLMKDSSAIPKLLNAKQIQFYTVTSRIPVSDFMNLWIESDKEMGSKLTFYLGSFRNENDGNYDSKKKEKSFEALRETFNDRIVDGTKEEKVIRINTDNPEKHILMRVINDVCTFKNRRLIICVYTVCQVIPATLKKEEYEKMSGAVEWDMESDR